MKSFVTDILTFYLSLILFTYPWHFIFKNENIGNKYMLLYFYEKTPQILWQDWKLEAFLLFRIARYCLCGCICIYIHTLIHTVTYTLTHISICTQTQHNTHLHIYPHTHTLTYSIIYIYRWVILYMFQLSKSYLTCWYINSLIGIPFCAWHWHLLIHTEIISMNKNMCYICWQRTFFRTARNYLREPTTVLLTGECVYICIHHITF